MLHTLPVTRRQSHQVRPRKIRIWHWHHWSNRYHWNSRRNGNNNNYYYFHWYVFDCDNIIDIIYIGDIIETNDILDILDNIGKIDTMETSVVENPKLVTHQQYVYQMKAEIILNSNLTSDFMICYCKFCVGATYRFFIHAKFLTSRLWRSPAAKPYKVSKKFLHEQMQEGST